jgi:hypothetical protein
MLVRSRISTGLWCNVAQVRRIRGKRPYISECTEAIAMPPVENREMVFSLSPCAISKVDALTGQAA